MTNSAVQIVAAATAKSLQSCPTPYDPIDGSLPGSSIPGFSRQEHWSGLPLPSPIVQTEKGSNAILILMRGSLMKRNYQQ